MLSSEVSTVIFYWGLMFPSLWSRVVMLPPNFFGHCNRLCSIANSRYSWMFLSPHNCVISLDSGKALNSFFSTAKPQSLDPYLQEDTLLCKYIWQTHLYNVTFCSSLLNMLIINSLLWNAVFGADFWFAHLCGRWYSLFDTPPGPGHIASLEGLILCLFHSSTQTSKSTCRIFWKQNWRRLWCSLLPLKCLSFLSFPVISKTEP